MPPIIASSSLSNLEVAFSSGFEKLNSAVNIVLVGVTCKSELVDWRRVDLEIFVSRPRDAKEIDENAVASGNKHKPKASWVGMSILYLSNSQ
jgi:hypothetical protein